MLNANNKWFQLFTSLSGGKSLLLFLNYMKQRNLHLFVYLKTETKVCFYAGDNLSSLLFDVREIKREIMNVARILSLGAQELGEMKRARK